MNSFPKATMILPCRGLEDGLKDHLRAALDQDYPDFEVLLVTTADDGSLRLLQEVATQYPDRCRVAIAPLSGQCAQKLQNQLSAMEIMSDDSQVIAFLDSDGEIDPGFVRRLIRPLDSPGVGMVTGYRWYLPEDGRFWSYVRSAWDAAALPFLVDNTHNIAFGGAMAVRRDIFERANIRDKWHTALSDDLCLAKGIKSLGLGVRFVPTCMVISREGCTFSQALEWTNRQTTISHVYMPEFWRSTAIAYSLCMALLAGLMILASLTLGVVALLSVFGFYLGSMILNVLLMVRTISPILDAPAGRELRRNQWKYIFAAPVASTLYGVNIIRSLCTRKITWRGITYVMKSPEETEIAKR